MSLRRHVPTIALCSATVLLATAGGATAAGLITGADIKNNTVSSADVKNGTLVGKDFSAAAKSSLRGARGPAGTDGTDGTDGVDGTDGERGLTGAGLDDFAYYQAVATAVPANTNDFIVEGDCPTGQSIVSAFAYWVSDNSPLQVSVGFINDTTMAAQAYSTGISSTDDATLQFSCATLPLPGTAKRQQLELDGRPR